MRQLIIRLPEEQRRQLEALAARQHTSLAELVRRAIAHELELEGWLRDQARRRAGETPGGEK